ncbi:MAG: protein kinase domain-containing protein [Methyloligellaceae bacterium]
MNYPLALKNGTILAQDYRIEGILGAGGSGITYIAKEISLDRNIAIKEYFPGDFAIREGDSDVCAKTEADEIDYTWGLDRFIDEAQTLAKFDHSNIVRVFRYFQTHNTAYMVLKFEEGQNFKSWIEDRDNPPTQEELDSIVTPLLDALELIHNDDFLHRDIAPDNIMIRQDGTPVLIDFGSARRVITSRPKTVSALIKPGYSPFEQYAVTGKDQGPWTDIYSLAATLYHAVTGKRPVDSPTRMVGDELVSAMKAAHPGYRKQFLKAIDSAMKLKTRARPQSIAEWRKQLFSTAPLRKAAKTKQPAAPAIKKSSENNSRVLVKKKKSLPPLDNQETGSSARNQNIMLAGKAFVHKSSRYFRRAFIKFLAEYARPEKNKELQEAGSLINRLSEMRKEAAAEKTLEEQLGEIQQQAIKDAENAKKKKAGFIKKILSSEHEADKEPKEPPVPNKSFEPQETGPSDQTEQTAEEIISEKPPQKLVTVRLNRKKLDVEPGPTTLARAKIRDQHSKVDAPAKTAKMSRFSVALLTMQMLMIIAIVLPIVYLFNLNEDSTTTGSLGESPSGIIHILRGHQNTVSTVSFAGNGTTLVSGGHDNKLRIWNVRSGKQTRLLNAHRSNVNTLDIHRNKVISADSRGEIIIWDLKTGKPLKNFRGHNASVSSVVFSGSDQKFFSGSTDRKIKFWHTVNTRKEQYAFKAHNRPVKSIVYSRRKNFIASASSGSEIKLWDLGTGRVIRRYTGHENGVNALAFSPSGIYLASGGIGEVSIWTTRSRRLRRKIQAHSGKITAITFTPNGKWIATAGDDKLIKIWNRQTGNLIKTFTGHTGRINSLAFTPDGKKLASAGSDATIRLWKSPSAIQ